MEQTSTKQEHAITNERWETTQTGLTRAQMDSRQLRWETLMHIITRDILHTSAIMLQTRARANNHVNTSTHTSDYTSEACQLLLWEFKATKFLTIDIITYNWQSIGDGGGDGGGGRLRVLINEEVCLFFTFCHIFLVCLNDIVFLQNRCSS